MKSFIDDLQEKFNQAMAERDKEGVVRILHQRQGNTDGEMKCLERMRNLAIHAIDLQRQIHDITKRLLLKPS